MINKIFQKTEKEMGKLNAEYERMTKENQIMASKISKSIKEKSKHLELRRHEFEKKFPFTRNK